jgi:hypothetical protein
MAKFAEWLISRRRTLDLVRVYLRAVIARWNDILWLSLPTFPFIIWWFLGSPPMWLVFLVLLWIFIVAGYYTWRADHLRLIPQVVLEEIRLQQAPAGKANRTYIQLVMTCATEAPVEECKGWLVHLWKWSESSNDWEKSEPNQALRLNWSPGNDAPITLFPGVPEIIDVIFVSDRDARMFFCANWSPQRAQDINLEQPSLFKFEVVVHGKDADLHKSLPALPISFKASIQRWPVIDSIEQL